MKPSKNTQSEQESLFAERQTIHPRIVFGFFSRLKALSGVILLSLYYLIPWLQWDNHQAILFDLPGRKFHILGLTFWPQDFIFLTFLLIVAGLTLFFVTTLTGRLWCGFACPQTIWTDAFLWMERLVEGDRPKQIKLEKSPMSFRKFRLKVTKHTLWLIFALFTGFTFVGYFTPIRELSEALMIFNLSESETFWLFFYAFATYGNAGWMREQVCIYMCPYSRFQSAMFDKDTMIIAYDEKRGESRGSRKKNNKNYKNNGLGDCIDCTMCVQVCPTGIDIRDGLQYECISCSACVDVCDSIMDKMGYPKGLVRYTTENRLNNKTTHIFRPRIFVYGGILLAIFIGIGYSIGARTLVELDVIRDRNSLFIENDDGLIENVYSLRIINIDDHPHIYEITASGIEGLQLIKDKEIQVGAGEVMTVPVRLAVDYENLSQRSTHVRFKLTARKNPELTVTEEARFLGPHH